MELLVALEIVVAITTGLVFVVTAAMAVGTFIMAWASTKQARATLSMFAAARVGVIDRQAKLVECLLKAGPAYLGIQGIDERPRDTVWWQRLNELGKQAEELFREATYEESRSAYDAIRLFFNATEERSTIDEHKQLERLKESPKKLRALRDGLQKWIEKPDKEG